jgi:hypothetical protein
MLSVRRFAVAFALAIATLGYADAARANATGYVCQSGWVPNPGALASYLGAMGAYGTVYAYVYSGAKCTGAQVGMAYFCTTGGTNSSYCVANQLMTERQAATLAASLQQAGASSQKVTLYTSGGANAGVYVEFTQP